MNPKQKPKLPLPKLYQLPPPLAKLLPVKLWDLPQARVKLPKPKQQRLPKARVKLLPSRLLELPKARVRLRKLEREPQLPLPKREQEQGGE